MNDQDRKLILLRAAYDLLTKAHRAYYVKDALSIVTFFDGAVCDGTCLREDIADELGIEPDTNPLPFPPEQQAEAAESYDYPKDYMR